MEYLLSFAGLSIKMAVPASTPLSEPLFLLISQDVRFVVASQSTALSHDLGFVFFYPILGPFPLLFSWINSSSLIVSL